MYMSSSPPANLGGSPGAWLMAPQRAWGAQEYPGGQHGRDAPAACHGIGNLVVEYRPNELLASMPMEKKRLRRLVHAVAFVGFLFGADERISHLWLGLLKLLKSEGHTRLE